MPYRFARTLSRCAECPLRDSRKVMGCGPAAPRIVFIGEAPGADEERLGEPFVGWAGKFLMKTLFELGLPRESVWLTNTILCRPANNDIKTLEAQEAIAMCSTGLWEELEDLMKRGAKVIGALGNTPLASLKVTNLSITKSRGSVFSIETGDPLSSRAVETIHVVPTFHPSHINRMKQFRDGDRDPISYEAVWRADINRIATIANHGWHPWAENFNLAPTVFDVEQFVSSCVEHDTLVAVDIETTGIDPHKSGLMVIGLADAPDHALSVPICSKYGGYYWNAQQSPTIYAALNQLFRKCRTVFHYSLFDVPFLAVHGIEVDCSLVVHDTYLLQKAINPELPLALGFVTSLYGTTPYWKEDFTGRTVPITYMEDAVLRQYNCRDAATLLQIIGPMLDKLSTSEQQDNYRRYMSALPDIISRHIKGEEIDEKLVDRYKGRIERDITKHEGSMRRIACLPAGFNFDSRDDLRYFIFGIVPGKFADLDEQIAAKTRTNTKAHAELIALRELRDGAIAPYVVRIANPAATYDRIEAAKKAIDRRIKAIKDLKRPTPAHAEELKRASLVSQWVGLYLEMSELKRRLSWIGAFKEAINYDGRLRLNIPLVELATGQYSEKNQTLLKILKDCKAVDCDDTPPV
jgi:uracil-DNA glycosylase family 4